MIVGGVDDAVGGGGDGAAGGEEDGAADWGQRKWKQKWKQRFWDRNRANSPESADFRFGVAMLRPVQSVSVTQWTRCTGREAGTTATAEAAAAK